MDPLSEDAWLLLAAVAPPAGRASYLDHLLKIHPGSEGARQAQGGAVFPHLLFRGSRGWNRTSVRRKKFSPRIHAPAPVPSDPVRQDKPSSQPVRSEKSAKESPAKPASKQRRPGDSGRERIPLGGDPSIGIVPSGPDGDGVRQSGDLCPGAARHGARGQGAKRDPADVHAVLHSHHHRVLYADIHLDFHALPDLHRDRHPDPHLHSLAGRVYHVRVPAASAGSTWIFPPNR